MSIDNFLKKLDEELDSKMILFINGLDDNQLDSINDIIDEAIDNLDLLSREDLGYGPGIANSYKIIKEREVGEDVIVDIEITLNVAFGKTEEAKNAFNKNMNKVLGKYAIERNRAKLVKIE
jgi:hypothetical protein